MDTHVTGKLDLFFSRFSEKKRQEKTIFIQPYDEIRHVYYLKTGSVRAYTVSEEGFEFTVHIFTQGAFFPLTGAIGKAQNRYYYETMTPIVIHEAPRDELLLFLKREPDVLFALTERLLRGLDRITSRMEQLAFAKASVRFASAILYFARHFGTTEGNQVHIQKKFTHKDIAAFAATTRETASREWEKLERRGIVGHINGTILVKNMQALEEEIFE